LGSFGREFLLMLAVVMPLTVFLFLSVPRLNEPLWGTRENQWESRTGLSEEMSPGDITELLGDDTPVMRVTFLADTPPRGSLYWRGPVLWQFDGRTWRGAPRLTSSGISEGRLRGPQSGGNDDVRYRVVLEPTDRNWLHVLDLATGFPADSSRSLEGVVTRDRPVTGLYAFEAASRIDAPLPVLAYPGLQTAFGLRLPEALNPRTLALAQRWVGEVGGDPMTLAQRALAHIRNENFSYSLSPPPLVGANRIDEFLFETQRGFCEHYAAAFVVLMRSAGVPARVVTGYLGGDFNRIGGYWIVRNSDAHAWAEVLVAGQGWVRVDPTAAIAPERVEQDAGALPGQGLDGDYAWVRALRERADAVQAWWNNAVVRFDSLRQQAFFADLGINPGDWKQVAAWMTGGLIVLGLLTALVFHLQQRREPEDAARRLYRRFLKDLARRGIVAAANEGPSDLARRAAAALPQLAAPILAFTRAYETARYGVPEERSLLLLQQSLGEFRKALRQS
jgi:transglutaminase-like putative cysteine protease